MSSDRRPGESDFLGALRGGINRLVPAGSQVVLAVSGGPDSVALLAGWRRFADDRGDRLDVAHFDHRLRPESADDARFVEDLAQQFGLPFHAATAASPLERSPGDSVESAARDTRYAFLSATARKVGARFVATGHTADDQAETVLHAVIRGAGIHGLAGMPAARSLAEGVQLIRPMLAIRRAQAERFLDEIGQAARLDSTNSDAAFTRNRIRIELLPLIRERFNPRVSEALLRLATLAERTSDFLQNQAAGLLDRSLISVCADSAALAIAPMRDVEPLLAAEAVRLLLDRQRWPRRRIGMAEIDRIVETMVGETARAWDLPDGLRVERSADRLVLRCEPQERDRLASRPAGD